MWSELKALLASENLVIQSIQKIKDRSGKGKSLTALTLSSTALAACGGGATVAPPQVSFASAPSDINLSSSSILENIVGGDVGSLTTTDSDSSDRHSYSVNDDRFEVVGNTLKLKEGVFLDFEATNSFEIILTATDLGNNSISKTFTILVRDVPPTITLDNLELKENVRGEFVGNVATIEYNNGGTFTFTVSDSRFEVVNGKLKLKPGVILDFEEESQITIEVTALNSDGFSMQETFTLTVTNTPDILEGIIINGVTNLDYTGESVSNVGDINNDGIDDFVVGASWADPNDKDMAGKSYIVFGVSSGFDKTIELSTLDGTNGFSIRGINADDISGFSVSKAGDVNNDGIADLIISAIGGDSNGNASTGQTYVIFGKASPFSVEFELSSLDGTNGFIINGEQSADQIGWSISQAGDVNGDGIDDIIIGSKDANIGAKLDAGITYIVFGTGSGFPVTLDLSALNGTNGFVVNGLDADDEAGISVSNAGDVNGDGIDDIIIGADQHDPTGVQTGEAYVIFGKDTGFTTNYDLASLNGGNGFVLNGANGNDQFGFSVSSAGDMNGDGFDDVLIGAIGFDDYSGASYVVFGKAGGWASNLNVSTLDGSNGFSITGHVDSNSLGWSVSQAGDINGDGYDDIIVGAPYLNSHDLSNSGESYIIFGHAGSWGANLNVSDLDGTNGFVIHGLDTSDFSGLSVSGAGDVNGDGVDDLLIGSPGQIPNPSGPGANEGPGQSFVIFGHIGNWEASYNLSHMVAEIMPTNSQSASGTIDVIDLDLALDSSPVEAEIIEEALEAYLDEDMVFNSFADDGSLYYNYS